MERRPAVGSKCGVGILYVCQVKDRHQERSDNNIDCSPSHLAHYIKKTATVRFILDHPVHVCMYTQVILSQEELTPPLDLSYNRRNQLHVQVISSLEELTPHLICPIG